MPKDNPIVGRTSFRCSVLKTLNLHLICVRFFAIAIALLAANLLGANFGLSNARVQAQTPNTTVNYQARILTAAGAVVPDGNYHVEFKIYDDISSGTTAQGSCSGNCLWMETRSTGNLVRVVDGYVSVNLGSVTAFPSNMPWSQNLYITMRVGGNGGSASWDTEMTNSGNRMKLNGAPLAYVANNVASSNTNAVSTNSSNISIQSGNALGTTSNSGSITIDTGTATGTTGTITLGATNASGITLGRSGLTTSNAGALTVTQLLTANGGATIAGGSQFTNASSSLFSAMAIANLPTGGAIGTAAATVDVATTFSVNQTTASQTLTLPTPTTATAGRLAFVNNVGSASFTMHGAVIAAGGSNAFMWNGSAWVTTVSLSGSVVNSIGTLDSQTKSADGAVISSNALYLQTADATYAGLVSTGSQTFAGTKTFNGGVILAASQSLTVTGGNTASRPGSPTEGMVYFDTDTDSLLTYTNGKWQSDRGEYVIVAASDSTQAEKDAADYVTDGTSDETEINSALTEAAGGKVLLLAGTYVADGTILIPNNTTLAGVGRGTLVQLADIDATDNLIENSDTSTGVGVVIRDLQLDGQDSLQTSGTQYGIYLNGVGNGATLSGGSIQNVWAHDFENEAIRLNNSDNVSITESELVGNTQYAINIIGGSTANIISGNVIDSNASYGIRFDSSTNNTVTNNNFLSNTSASIYIGNSSNNNSFASNTISGSAYGMFIIGSTNTTISDNNIYNTGSRGVYNSSNSHNSVITGNTITTTSVGIDVSGSNYVTLNNNSITGATTYGVYVSGSNNAQISGNTLHDNGGSTTNQGIFIGNSSYASVTGNTITDTACTTSCYAIRIDDAFSYKNYLSNNRFSGSSSAAASISDVSTSTIYAGQQTNTSTSTNSDVTDFTFRGSANSANAFAVLNASGSNIFNVDTSTAGISVSGTASVSGNLTVDTSTLFVNATNDFVSVGSTSDLGARFQVVGANNETQLLVRANGTQSMSNPLVLLQNSSGSELARINATTSSLFFGNAAGGSSAAGVNNTGIGASALGSVSTGTGNTTLGSGALASVSGNNNNTAVGYNAGNLATGGNNIFLGALAGDNVTTGTDNIIIGYNLDASAAGVSNELRIGGVLQGNTATLAAQFNGALTVSGDLVANGNTTIGDANTDRLTVTSQLLGGSPLVFQGATDNGFETTLALTDPTADQTYRLPNLTAGTYDICTSGNNCTALTGYIQNNTTAQNNANINIQSTGTSNVTLKLRANTSQTANIIEVRDSTDSSNYLTVGADGAFNSIYGGSSNGFNVYSTGTPTYTAGFFAQSNSGTSANGVIISKNSGASGTVTNLLQLQQTTGTVTNALTFSGTFTNLINSPSFTVTNAGALTAVGVNSGTGLIQGTGGLTVSGATASINASSNFNTNINTGTSTGAVSIGNSVGGAITLQSASTITTTVADNLADALDLQEGTNNYININTTNASENISFGNATTNPSYSFLGSGTLSVAGPATVNGLLTGSLGLTVTGATANINASSNFTTNINTGTSTGAVNIGNNTGNTALTLDSGTGTIAIGTGAQARTINLGTGAAAQTLNIGSLTGAGVTTINAGTGTASGDLNIQAAAAGIINIGNNAVTNKILNLGSTGSTNAASTINIASTNANQTQSVTIGNTGSANNVISIQGGSSSTAIRLFTAAGGTINIGATNNSSLNLNTAAVAGTTTIGGTSTTGTITLGQSTASNTISIGSAAGNGNTQTINLGTSATAGSTTNVTIGSAIAGTVTLQGNVAVPNLSATTGATFVCRNASNLLSTCTSTPLTNTLTDNITDAFDLQEGTNNYININTTNSSENISFGNATTNPSYNFLGSGTLAVAGAQTIGGNLTVDTDTFYVDAVSDFVAIGTTSAANSRFNVAENAGASNSGSIIQASGTLGYTTGAGELQYAFKTFSNVTPTAAASGSYFGGVFGPQGTSTANLTNATIGGVYGLGTYTGTSGSLGDAIGGRFTVNNSSTGTITRAFGIQVPNFSNASGTISNRAGLQIDSFTTASTNATLVLLGTNTIPSGDFSIYNASAQDNVFQGNLSIGSTTAPTVALDVTGAGIFSGDFTVNGNTTLGNATTDRLTVTAQLLGGSPLAFQGATDNGFATTLAVTEPTANNTITLPDQSGTVLLGASGTGNAIVQVPTSNTAGAQGANVIAPTTNSIVGLKVSRTTGTATNAIQVNTATVADTTAQILVSTGATTQKGLVIQRVASQTANPLEVQNESGTPIAYVAASGNIITEGEFISQYSVRSSDGTGASSSFTVRSGNTTGGSGLSTGSLTLQSGNGSGTNTSSGNVILDAGSVSGSGTAGVVNIAQTNASAVNIGRAGVVTTLSGNIAVPNLSATTGTTFVCRNASNYLSGCTGTPITNALTDNTADAFDLQEGTNNYININTTDSSENISFGNATTNPSYNFLGSGSVTIGGDLNVTGTTYGDWVQLTGGLEVNDYTEFNGTVYDYAYAGLVNVFATSSSTTNDQRGLTVSNYVAPGSASTRSYTAVHGNAGSDSTNLTGGLLSGVLGQGSNIGTGTIGIVAGVEGQVLNQSSGTISNAYALYANGATNSGTISNNYGLFVKSVTAGTNDYGIYVEGADTVGLLVDSGSASGVTARFNNQTSTGNILEVQDNGSNVFVVADGGSATFTGNVSVSANYSLTLNGGATGTRPASPTEGMIYYDTTTKQLLVYANGKWQTDRTDAILVAASNSSQTDKDIADYIGDGNTVAANDGDQVQINNALTAASGRKVVLLAGTYTVDATILVPNNTTFMGVGNGTVVEFADIDATDYMIENSDTTTGTGVVIRDMKLDGRNDLNTGTQRAIYLNGLGNGTGTGTVMGGQVKNLTITRFNSEHIYLNNSDNNEISGNTSYNANGAIVLASSNNNTITNNIMSFIQGVSAGGIIMTSSNYNVIDGNSITSSVLTGSLGYGLSDNGTNNIITNNSITTSLAIGSVRLTGTNSYTVFSGNFIGSDATTFTGTYINATNNTFSGSVTISGNNNTMSDNKVAGSITNSGSNTSITGNSVTISINASSGTYVNIENNTVSAASGTAITVGSSNGSITGNTIITPTTTGISVTGANNTVSSNTITNSGGATANNGLSISGDDNIVSANMVSDTSNSTTCNAIVINSGADRTYISSNKLIGCTAAMPPVISDSGTNTTQSAQITRANSSLTTSSILRSKGSLIITGSIDPAASTTVPGVGTSFTTELEVGDRILVSGETRTITAISSDTSLTVDVAFSNNANDTSVDRLAASLLVRNSSNTNTIIVDSDGAATFRNSTNSTTAFSVQNSSGTSIISVDTTNSRVGINTSSPSADLSFGDGANRTINVIARTTAGTGYNLTVAAGQGNGANTGGALNLNGGAAGAANANGGNVVIAGGAGAGSGVSGLVVISNPTFQTATVQNFTSSGTITQANVDSNGAILISSNAAGYTATMGDPTITTAGRVVYVTNSGTFDMTLSVNGGGSGNTITLKPATTATMIWNGSDWTAAGASSSTDLQAAYNNTATSAGGAELILNAPGGSADGLTIRNNGTSPIIGGLLEVQSSIGSNLFTVNNNATEYANNGGAESSTFTMWTGAFAGGTVARDTTSTNVATGQGSVSVVTTATGHGAENTLTTTLTPNLKYAVAYTVKGTSNFSTLETVYSRDGTNTSTTSCNSAQTVTTSQFTRISCTFTAPSSGITASNSIFIRQTDATGRTFYIDNLSVTVSADVNHAADGSVDLALGSNWTDFGANTSGTTAAVRNTTVLYDTSGSVEKTTGATADRGIINNLTISPAVSTQYLVTFYARSSNTFNDIRVRYSRDGGTNFVSCTDYNTQAVSTTAYTRITCIFTTDGTTATNPDLVIDQPTATARTFYVDALTVSLNTNNSNNVQIGGGRRGGPTTLFTLDRSSGAPIAANNDAYLGSMYYDTSTGRIQCYEADGWGACGAAPDNIVNLNPEYAGAVLNGSGVGTMTADFCGNGGGLSINTSLCASGESRNFYRWTSPQATQQTYSIYVTYQLPTTFNGFSSDDTIQLTGRVDSTTNAAVTYEVFRSTGSTITQCGTGETSVITTPTGSAGVAGTWYSYGINGNESTGCGFNSSAAGNFVIFKINLKANSNANAYVSTLSFTTTGR